MFVFRPGKKKSRYESLVVFHYEYACIVEGVFSSRVGSSTNSTYEKVGPATEALFGEPLRNLSVTVTNALFSKDQHAFTE